MVGLWRLGVGGWGFEGREMCTRCLQNHLYAELGLTDHAPDLYSGGRPIVAYKGVPKLESGLVNCVQGLRVGDFHD